MDAEAFSSHQRYTLEVEVIIKHPLDGSENLKKNGHAPTGKQRYRCKDCGRASLENPDYGYSEARKEEILKAYRQRSSMRGVARTFGVSRNTLSTWLKKSREDANP